MGPSHPFTPEYSFDPADWANHELVGLGISEPIELGFSIGKLTRTAKELFRQRFEKAADKLSEHQDTQPREVSLYIPQYARGEDQQVPLLSFPTEQWKSVMASVDEVPKILEHRLFHEVLRLVEIPVDDLQLSVKGVQEFIRYLDGVKTIVLFPLLPGYRPSVYAAALKAAVGVLPKAKKRPGLFDPFDLGSSKLPKVHWSHIEECLDMWDLKAASPAWTNAKIAQKVFDGDLKRGDPEAPIRRVIRAYEKAELLINGGGFRQIR